MSNRTRWTLTLGIGAALFAAGCAPQQTADRDATVVDPGAPGGPVVTAPAPGSPGSVATTAGSEQSAKAAADRVEDLLEADATLKPFDLDADEEDNRVVVKGRVETAAQKSLAEEIARQNAAGQTIVSEIRVDD